MPSFPNTPSNRKFSSSKVKKKGKKGKGTRYFHYILRPSRIPISQSSFLDLSVENESRQRIACRLCKKNKKIKEKKEREKRKKRRLTRETNLLFPFSPIVADNSIDVDDPPLPPPLLPVHIGLVFACIPD